MTANASGFEFTQQFALPRWIDDEQGRAFEATFGRTKNDGLALLKEAVKARWPDADRPDALPMQGNDRLILRAPLETDAQYAARLLAAHDLWEWGGTKTGIVNIFAPYGYDDTTLLVCNNHDLAWDSNADWFSRVFILASPVAWASDGVWDGDSAVFDDGGTWDSTATIADLDYIRASIRTWKSPWSYPFALVVDLGTMGGGALWDLPAGTWDAGSPGVWDDITAGTEPLVTIPLAAVWDDEAWLGGAPVWDEDDDPWGDPYVAPSTGWHIRI